MPKAIDIRRREAIWIATAGGRSHAETAQALGISLKTVSRILARGVGQIGPSYAQCGRNGREHAQDVRQRAIEIKQQHPKWGGQRIQLEFKKKDQRIPGVRTLQTWFRQAGVSQTHEHQPGPPRQRGREVHDVWEVDAKEQVHLADQRLVTAMMSVDEASGALISATSFPPGLDQCCGHNAHPRRIA